MNYAIESITSVSGDRYRMTAIASIRPRTNASGVWYYPVYGWYINRSYRTEFTGTVSVSTGFSQPSTVNFYLCGPVDEDYFTVEVDPDTGLPNLPIIRQETIYNPGTDDEDDKDVSASFNIGAAYDNTEIAANEVYILFVVRVGANTSDGAVRANFSAACTDDGPPPYDGEWHIFHAPYYNEDYITTTYDESNPYSVSNISLPQYNLLCFRIDNTDTSGNPKDGSWTVELSAGANAVIYAGTSYRWNSKTGVPAAQYIEGAGTSIKWQDINPTMSYIWIRFLDGASQGDVSVNIYFMETQVQTDWHAHVPTISMNNGSVLPVTGSEIWSSGLGEKEVLVYRFKLSENFAPEFSYSGSQSMWMCISTVEAVNSRTGMPNPQTGMRGQGSGTDFTVTASQVLTAGTWYYLFIETTTGEPYNGQITVTYVTGIPPTPPEPEWSYGDISAQTDILVQTTREVTLAVQTGAMFRVSFRFSGAASFSVSGSNAEAYIYATTGNYGFSTLTGRPKDINGNELSDAASTSVYVAGSGYYTYIWVRGQTAETAGTVTVTITPPQAYWTEEEVGEKDITVTSESFIRTFELNVQQLTVYRFDLVFSRSATVQIYSVGSTQASDVRAYFSTIPRTFDRTTGHPESYDALWEDTEPGNYNFNSGALEVAGGTTYYLWIRGVAADTTAHIWINIAGGGSSGNEKIWLYTNGQWVPTTIYDYISNVWGRMGPYDYVGSIWK